MESFLIRDVIVVIIHFQYHIKGPLTCMDPINGAWSLSTTSLSLTAGKRLDNSRMVLLAAISDALCQSFYLNWYIGEATRVLDTSLVCLGGWIDDGPTSTHRCSMSRHLSGRDATSPGLCLSYAPTWNRFGRLGCGCRHQARYLSDRRGRG